MKTIINKIKSIRRTYVYKLTFLLAFQMQAGSAFGQDTLQYRNGNMLEATVTEITPTEIKFRISNNEKEVNYSEDKNKVAFIKHKNGEIDVFDFVDLKTIEASSFVRTPMELKQNPVLVKYRNVYTYGNHILNNKSMYNLLLSVHNKKITPLIKEASRQKRWQYIGFLALPTAVAGWAAFVKQNPSSAWDKHPNKTPTVIGGTLCLLSALCVTTTITMKVKRNANEKAALKLFHDNY